MLILFAVLAGVMVGYLISHFAERSTRQAVEARALAAEVRLGEFVDRLSTEPRLELREAQPAPEVSEEPSYITEHPYMDTAWNEFRGIEEEVD